MVEKETKYCKCCKTIKTVDLFNRNKNLKDGLSFYCKKCNSKKIYHQETSKIGVALKIFRAQKCSNKSRGFGNIGYSKEWFLNWILSQNQFNVLYSRWVKSSYSKKLKPSVDRINNYKGYTKDNIKLVDFNTNSKNYLEDVKNSRNSTILKPVCKYSLDGEFICSYPSIKVASKYNNVQGGTISLVCKGKRKTSGGFIWKYLSNENRIKLKTV